MKSALEKLSAAGAEFYASAQAAAGSETAPPPPPPPPPGGKTEKKADVVDADFEVVYDDKPKQ